MANALTKANGKGLGRPVRSWWRAHDPGAMASRTTMLAALRDLHFVSCGHLMRRMTSPKTPEATKDAIALAMAPKLVAEFRGRISQADRPPEPGNGVGDAGEMSGRDILLQGYAEKLRIKAG